MKNSTSSEDIFDYVIVGAGAAGCVLAARLTEDPRTTVCLLEAGPKDWNPLIRIPAGVIKLLFDSKVTWQFHTEGSPGTGGRRIFAPQGRTLGGSSSINGMIYNRGLANDFNAWAQMGNLGWSYADVLPYFKKYEGRIGGADSPYHGRSGPLPVSDADWKKPIIDAFISGVERLGIPRNPDYNGASQAGVGYLQRTIRNGRRVSAAAAFLAPARIRSGLDVRCNALANKIVFEGRRAVGVAYTLGKNDKERFVRARREVIVAAGSLNTPKLLQLSGIGPAAALKELGIPVVHDLPGVGRNLRDHYGTRTVVAVKNSKTANELSRWPYLGIEIAKWLVKKPSILGLSSSLAYVFWKSDEALDVPDLQFVLTPISFKAGQFGVLDDFPGISLAVWPHRPQSSGYVLAKSTNAYEDPIIQPNYLAQEADRRAMIAGIRLTRKFLGTPELSHYIEGERVPGTSIASDEDILNFAHQNGSTIYHFVGTSRMGPSTDREAVVGSDLRVHGLAGLRIVDASIMPSIPSGNTYASTLMIAEKAADMVRETVPIQT